MSVQFGASGASHGVREPFSWQLSRYALVSIAALAIDVGVYLLAARLGLLPAIAGLAGYAVGMLAHYALSTWWVFDARGSGKGNARLATEFIASGLLGLALTAMTIALATQAMGLALVPAKLLAVGVSFLAVFLVRRTVVFAARA